MVELAKLRTHHQNLQGESSLIFLDLSGKHRHRPKPNHSSTHRPHNLDKMIWSPLLNQRRQRHHPQHQKRTLAPCLSVISASILPETLWSLYVDTCFAGRVSTSGLSSPVTLRSAQFASPAFSKTNWCLSSRRAIQRTPGKIKHLKILLFCSRKQKPDIPNRPSGTREEPQQERGFFGNMGGGGRN